MKKTLQEKIKNATPEEFHNILISEIQNKLGPELSHLFIPAPYGVDAQQRLEDIEEQRLHLKGLIVNSPNFLTNG